MLLFSSLKENTNVDMSQYMLYKDIRKLVMDKERSVEVHKEFYMEYIN